MLTIGQSPYPYCTIEDILTLAPQPASVLRSSIAQLPAGGIDRLILSNSRFADTYLAKRISSVPITETPHAAITRFVALLCAADLHAKIGELPGSDQSEIRRSLLADLRQWIESVVDADGFCEIPGGPSTPERTTLTRRRIRGSSSESCYATATATGRVRR